MEERNFAMMTIEKLNHQFRMGTRVGFSIFQYAILPSFRSLRDVRRLVAVIFSIVLASSASALDIQLPLETRTFKQGAGADLANGQCLICHSVEYVTMQPPMSRAFWKSEVVKMQQKYGAQITEAQIEPLADYLTRDYGLSTNAAQALAPAPTPTPQSETLTGAQVAAKYYCLACHSPTVKVGPPYAAIAAKYKNDPKAVAQIDHQIHNGGSGKWGTTPMPAFQMVTPEETKALAEWILATK